MGACGGELLGTGVDGLGNDECGVCSGGNSSCSGCMDETACNLDEDATLACENCCLQPAENYDCEGYCIAEGEGLDENGLDCALKCGGPAHPNFPCACNMLVCNPSDCNLDIPFF